MRGLEYVKFDQVDPAELLPILNKQKVRQHLMEHHLFDEETLQKWLAGKLAMDASSGCKLRVIELDKRPGGWCGIQIEDGQYELAIVLDDEYWGLGRQVFKDMMSWAKTLGHETLFIHFLHTRPEYRFLRKISRRVFENELYGHRFITYELIVK